MAGQAELHSDFHVVNEALREQPFDRVPAVAHATSMTCGLRLALTFQGFIMVILIGGVH